jgi:hypothetical protein
MRLARALARELHGKIEQSCPGPVHATSNVIEFRGGVSLKLFASEAGCYGGAEAIAMQSPNRNAKVFGNFR